VAKAHRHAVSSEGSSLSRGVAVLVARKVLPNAYSVILLALVPWCVGCSGSFNGPSAGRYAMATDPARATRFATCAIVRPDSGCIASLHVD
jgi:hypothetical protein